MVSQTREEFYRLDYRECTHPGQLPTPGLDFHKIYGHHQSPAIRANGLIFVSGMVAVDPETGDRLQGTVTSETHRIFQNLKIMLESAGSSLEKIVQVHACIYDRIEYDVLNRVYEKYLVKLPPARTVWSVKIESGFKVQLDIIAAA
jgi:2-iminobutanoate/2-iminopropanoate deaminase